MHISEVKFNEKEAELEAQLATLRQNKAQFTQICKVDLPQTRVKLAAQLSALETLGIEEDYKEHLSLVVQNAGPSGLSLSIIRKILPEADRLSKARKELTANGVIKEKKEGMSLRLVSVGTTATVPTAAQ